MDISRYIDEQVEYLYDIGVYDRDKDGKRITEKRDKIKKILESDVTYASMSYDEKKYRVDLLVQDIINKDNGKRENESRKEMFGSEGVTLLMKQSITTGENLEIAYGVIGSGSMHLHCGISRDIDYVDSNGKEITHYHNLLRKLKSYVSIKYSITDKEEIEKICNEEVIEPYIREILKNAIAIYDKYPHIKTIRLDTNDGFFRQMKPFLDKYGFHPNREVELMEELQCEFPNYKFPKELDRFYRDYPDRKNSVTIHSKELKNRLIEMGVILENKDTKML